MSRPSRLGIIGLGVIAPFFVRAADADPELTLVAACDIDETKLRPFAERGVATFTDYKALLQAELVDSVIITLPNDLHAPVAIDALERGIAVCCEKPLAIEPADALAMVEAAKRGAAVLFTAFHRRHNSNMLRLARQLPADHAQITQVVARYHENIAEHTGDEDWYLDAVRCGGGCLIDNGPNALDAVRLLAGELSVVDATTGDIRAGTEFYAELDLVSHAGVPVRVELDWALPTGETKDVQVELRDGRVLRADMLAGYDGFKASLDHEYRGILDEFKTAGDPGRFDAGPALVQLVHDAYAIARTKERRLRMVAKDPVSTRVVKLLFHSLDGRGMTFSPWLSRCVPAGQIHELVTTTDRPARPGDRVDRVGFLGFTEFRAPAVIERGDEVWLGQRRLGTVAGFDECHAPNHLNILIDADRLLTAGDVDLRPGDEIRFLPAPPTPSRGRPSLPNAQRGAPA